MQCTYMYMAVHLERMQQRHMQYLITVLWDIQPEYGSVCIDTKVVFIIAHPPS